MTVRRLKKALQLELPARTSMYAGAVYYMVGYDQFFRVVAVPRTWLAACSRARRPDPGFLLCDRRRFETFVPRRSRARRGLSTPEARALESALCASLAQGSATFPPRS